MRTLPGFEEACIVRVLLVRKIRTRFYLVELPAQRVLCSSLQHGVQSRVDAIPLALYRLKTDLSLHLLMYEIDCVRLRYIGLRLDSKWPPLCLLGNSVRDLVFLSHSGQDKVPFLGGGLKIVPGRKIVGALQQRRQHSRL